MPSNDQQPALSENDPSATGAGKGRPTPKRKDAEAANKRPLVSSDRKGAARVDRTKAKSQRDVEYRAMQAGDEAKMPLKDRGPQRRFIRDSVDARWNLGELLLPIAVVLIIVQFAFAKSPLGVLAVYVLYLYVVLFSIDCFLMWRGVKKRLRAKFGDATQLKGAAFYTITRSVQIRRTRLPKPKVKHGEYPV